MHNVIEFWHDDHAQDLIEYALLAGFVALAAMAGVQAFGVQVAEFWHDVAVRMPSSF